MRLLLDTHTFLWFILDRAELSRRAASLMEDPANVLLLSTAALWEIAIKASLGKLALAQPFGVLIPQQLHINDIQVLPITLEHLVVVSTLPFHHRDPFDRLMAAQAMVEGVPLLSRDRVFDAYGVRRLW